VDCGMREEALSACDIGVYKIGFSHYGRASDPF